ncbi:hypothetical protein EDB89DRAFT_1910268 [Lactarius sanguifluus]|nr:hypothetical protein EDB89DRAFT_1910268 [Lactarius sanguifluus]
MDNYKLFYFAEGKETTSGVVISKSTTVLELRIIIYEDCSPSFWDGARAGELTLLKVDIDPRPYLGAIQDLRAGHNVQMDVTGRVDEIWPDQPNERHLHICVRIPSVIPYVPQQGDVHSQFKRARIATEPPSSLAKSQAYVNLQRDSRQRILDDRPEPDHQIPPIPLLYSAFGHFLDPKLQIAVDALATEMTRFFETESPRREKGLEHLNDIFSARWGTQIPQISASAIEISAVPQVQVAGFVAHLNAAVEEGSVSTMEGALLGPDNCWLFDDRICLGCDITFYAVLAVDHQIRLVSLTPTLSCVPIGFRWSRPQSPYIWPLQQRLYCKLKSSRMPRNSMMPGNALKDSHCCRNACGGPSLPRRYPNYRYAKYATSHGLDDYLTFEICGLLDDCVLDRLLYKAKRPGIDELILIKRVMHRRSLVTERLPGGWFAVAMEYVKPDTSITESTHGVRWKQELVNLMESFHAKNLVHGDLRDVNIICRGDSVMLVDFDWGGKVGEVSYPTLALNAELLDGRVTDDLMISISDDARVLRKTLDKL